MTESGHEFHVDDTPGKERLRVGHMSGTYHEVSPDGKKVEMVVGHDVHYVKGGLTQTVDKNADVKVGGSSRTSVSGDKHEEVKGDVSSMTSGSSHHITGGDHVHAVKGDHVVGVVGTFTGKFGGGANVKFDGAKSMKVDGAANLEFGSTLGITAEDVITIESKTKIVLKVGGSTVTITDQGITLKSPVNVLDASDKNKIGASLKNVITTDAEGTQVEATNFPPVGKDVGGEVS